MGFFLLVCDQVVSFYLIKMLFGFSALRSPSKPASEIIGAI